MISRNYNTVGRLTRPLWREIINEYPKFHQFMVKYTHLYKDVNIRHQMQMLRKISFIKNHVPPLHQKELAYQLKSRILAPGEII